MTPQETDSPRPDAPTFSVIIGLVSTEDGERILETLAALSAQQGDHSYEVILADRKSDRISAEIADRFPGVKLIRCPADTSLPVLRTTALSHAKGLYVVVTEDHCVPPLDWFQAIYNAFQEAAPETAAVGGSVENGVTDRALDWATFFCEYGTSLPPVPEGEAAGLPGMNVAYKRSVLTDLDQTLLTKGFWETTVHGELLRRGMALHSTNSIAIDHCKKFSFRLFAAQRFLYSRYYAGIRFERGQYLLRLIACLLTPALPFILLYRIRAHLWSTGRYRREFVFSLPSLSVFLAIWSFGEMVGYILGEGDALSRIE